MKIAITGANSSVGVNLLSHIAGSADTSAVAGVRSETALQSLPQAAQIEPRIISYADVDALATALAGAECVVHLAGILLQDRHNNYASANVDATAAVVAAAQHIGAAHFIFISVIGADPLSSNAYFSSKGLAETVVSKSGLSASIIRTPLLLGPATAGASALLGAAAREKTRILAGGRYTMSPLDINDLSRAILRCCAAQQPGATVYELAGPQALPYRALIEQTATLMERTVAIKSFPVWLAKLGAAVTSAVKGGGITPTVIDVITANEVVVANADTALGITLTPLQATLQAIVQHRQGT